MPEPDWGRKTGECGVAIGLIRAVCEAIRRGWRASE